MRAIEIVMHDEIYSRVSETDLTGPDTPEIGDPDGLNLADLHRTLPQAQEALLDAEAGRTDPLFEVACSPFGSYVGHKEAIRSLPPHAVVLATSPRCPVQAFRVGTRVYATQFHPELDLAGLAMRVQTYKYAGYFEPETADAVIAAANASGVTETPDFLGRFVELFARD